MTFTPSRREFLQSAAAGAAALYVGIGSNGTLAAGSDKKQLNPFVKIGADGHVSAIVKHFEKGQGPATGLTTLIAEELGVTMDQIDYEFAPSDAATYNNLFFGPMQGTGGSTAMANSFMQYRQAGAAARDMLLAAASEAWGIDQDQLSLTNGIISAGSTSAPLAEFAVAASKMPVPESPRLKTPEEFKLIGNPNVKRKDTPLKVNGQAKFAMDVQLANQMIVVIARSPRMGGLVSKIDDSEAKQVRGYIRALPLPNKVGVAVYAESTWAAFQARDALSIEWDNSAAESRSSDQIRQELLAAVKAAPTYKISGDAEVASRLNAADKIVEHSFYFPLLAHAPMEPLTCTIEATSEGGVLLHDGCQITTIPHMAMAQILQLPPEKVQIKTMFAGGSFGRRATPSADYQVEVALAFAMTDRTRPLKLVWSREDDMTGGYYRPAFAHHVRVGLNKNGEIVGWDHRIAGQSIVKGTAFESAMVKNGVDHSSVEGVPDSPYEIPGLFVGLTDIPKATSVLWWRSVGHTHTAYVMESMMDAVAKAADRDPVELRLSLLASGNKDQQRLAGVLWLAAVKGNWGHAPKGRSQGVAVHKSFSSYVAEVVEVSGTPESGIQIEKVTCAVDCGIAVNPDVIKAQMEGGIGYGIGHAMRNEITLTDGAVDQVNFPDYEPLRIGDIAEIDVHIVPSTEAPTGVGEPGTPPAAPALANAIAAAGKRVTALPMINNGVEFA